MKVHKKANALSPSQNSKENVSKLLISFIESKSDTNRRSIIQIFDYLSQLDLTKIPISKLKGSTLLYINALNELISRANKNKVVFRIVSVVLCAQMITEVARIINFSSGIDIDLSQLLFSNEKIFRYSNESEIPSFPIRKNQKLHSYSSLLAFLIRHHPQCRDVKQIFCYALFTMFERANLKQLFYQCVPQLSPTQFCYVPHKPFNCSTVTPESLMEISNSLKNSIDPVSLIFVRFISNKIFGAYNFDIVRVNSLVDTVLDFLEADPEYKVDDLTPLLLYYTCQQTSYPIHLTYTSVDHCLFFICLGLSNLLEPTTSDILISTISFENAPGPSLALVFDHNLNNTFVPDFMAHALSNHLSDQWNEEIKYLLQYVKLPPKREDLVELAKNNNIDSIKLLLKDPECLPLLKPNDCMPHKLLSLFLKPIELPLPKTIGFGRYDAAFIYNLRTLKEKPDQSTIAGYIKQLDTKLIQITMNQCNNDKILFHAIYSGLQPIKPKSSSSELPEPKMPPSLPAKKITGPEFFFLPSDSSEYEDISLIIDNLINLISNWKMNFDNDKEIIEKFADFNHHYYLSLSHSERDIKLFGKLYKDTYDDTPYSHLLSALKDIKAAKKKNEVVNLFKPIISSPSSQSSLITFVKNVYQLKDENTFPDIIKCVPNLSSIDLSILSNEELLDILRVLISSDITKNVNHFSRKLIENDFKTQLFQLFLSSVNDHPIAIASICHNLSNVGDFAEYFFNNLIKILPDQITIELSSLMFFLSKFIKPSKYELPTYPKLKVNSSAWKEDHKTNAKEVENTNNADNANISNNIRTVMNKLMKPLLYNGEEEEEEESEEAFEDGIIDSGSPIEVPLKKDAEYQFSTKSQPSIWEVPNLKHCTYIETGSNYEPQPFFRCITCNYSSNQGVCEYCATHCHKGHLLYYDGIMDCYCDCFENPEVCFSNPDHKKFHRGHNYHRHHNNDGSSHKYKPSLSVSSPSSLVDGDHLEINNDDDNELNRNLIELPSKCVIDLFLKLAKTQFLKFEQNDPSGFCLRNLRSVKLFDQITLSPHSPLSSTFQQLKKRISRVKALTLLLDKRSNYKQLSLACKIGEDAFCYTNGGDLFASNIQNQSVYSIYDRYSSSSTSNSNLNLNELAYYLASSGGSLIACLCDSCVHIIKITKNDSNQQLPQQILQSIQQQQQQVQRLGQIQLQQLQQQQQQLQQELQQLQQQPQNQQQQQQYQQQQQEVQQQLQLLQHQIHQVQQLQQLQQRQQQLPYLPPGPRQQPQTLNQWLNIIRQPNTAPQQQNELNPPRPPQSNNDRGSTQSRNQPQQTYNLEIVVDLPNPQPLAVSSSPSSSPSPFSSPSSLRQNLYIDAFFIKDSIIVLLDFGHITSFSLPSGNKISSVKSDRIQFTSMARFKHQDKDYILVGNATGQLSAYSISPEGNIVLDHFVGIDRPSSPVVVSSSYEDDLIFISSEKVPLTLCRSSDLFNATQSLITIGDISNSVTYSGKIKTKENTFVLFFTKTKNGGIFSVEFKSNSYVVSSLGDEVIPEEFLQPTFAGSFVIGENLYCLSPDGILLKSTVNENRNKSSDSDQQSSNAIANDEVPITFWSRTIKSSRDIIKLYANDTNDVTSLLTGPNFNIPPNTTIKFTATPIGSEYTIVGIRIFAMSNPSSLPRIVEMNGRNYKLTQISNMPTCIALRPDEVHPGSSVSFTFQSGTGLLIIKSINIHTFKSNELTIPPIEIKKPVFNWMTDSLNIFDFCEESLNDISKDDEKAQIELKLALGFNDDGKIPEDYIQQLIVNLYTSPGASLQSRLLLLKLKFDHQLIQKIWAETMRSVVEDNKIHPSLIDTFWRDFTLLDSQYRKEIQNIVWNNVPQQNGISCLLSAFY